MFRHILLAVLFPILLLTGLSVQAVQTDTQTVTVTVRYLNVRQAANINSKILVVVRAGQTYPVIDQSGTWWQIRVGEITGYVSGRYVKVNGSASVTVTPAPVVTAPDLSTCTRTLFFLTTPEDICVGAVMKTQAAFQTYEHGFMVWLADSGDIWVFINVGRTPWLHLRQSDYAGFSDNALTAPSGLVQPINGFGRAWANYHGFNQATLKDELGWATASEVSYTATWQFYGAASVINTYITVPDGRIADAYNGMAGIFWSFVR